MHVTLALLFAFGASIVLTKPIPFDLRTRQEVAPACSVEEGVYNCLDGSSYQMCTVVGQWSTTMQMSAGERCTEGRSSDLGRTRVEEQPANQPQQGEGEARKRNLQGREEESNTEQTQGEQTPGGVTGGGETGPCTIEGIFNCIGGSNFQRCASGVWSVVQQMAAGTTCQEGQSQGLAIAQSGQPGQSEPGQQGPEQPEQQPGQEQLQQQ